MTEEQRNRIVSARKNSMGYAKIATEIGMTKNAVVLLLAVFVLALPKTFAKTCSHVLPHNGLKFGTSQDAKL